MNINDEKFKISLKEYLEYYGFGKLYNITKCDDKLEIENLRNGAINNMFELFMSKNVKNDIDLEMIEYFKKIPNTNIVDFKLYENDKRGE